MPHPAAAEHVRRALSAGPAVVLEGRLRQRAERRGHRAATSSTAPTMPTMHSTMHLYPIDGARRRVKQRATRRGATATRAGRRSSSASIRTRPTRTRSSPGRRSTGTALHPYSAGGAYVNFMMEEGEDRVKATYREQLRPARGDQEAVRSDEPVPREPEHQARKIGSGFQRARRQTELFGPGRSTHLFCRQRADPASRHSKNKLDFALRAAVGSGVSLATETTITIQEVPMLFLLAGAVAVCGFAAVCLFLSTGLLFPR